MKLIRVLIFILFPFLLLICIGQALIIRDFEQTAERIIMGGKDCQQKLRQCREDCQSWQEEAGMWQETARTWQQECNRMARESARDRKKQ